MMYATKKNFRVVNKIIKIMHEEKVTIAQALTILDKVKSKMMSEAHVNIPSEEDTSNLPEDV